MKSRPAPLWAAAFLLAAAACTSATQPQITATIAPSAPPSTLPTTTLRADVDPAVRDALVAEVTALVAVVEDLRGLRFVREPPLEVIPAGEFSQRLADYGASHVDPDVLGPRTAWFRLAGVLAPTEDLETALAAAVPGDATAFYDADASSLVVSADVANITAPVRAALVHELVHALTDQYFSHSSRTTELRRARADDQLRAQRALVEGDATYFQLLYVQGLPAEDQRAVADDFAASEPALRVPRVAGAEVAFPFDNGVTFVAEIVTSGGTAALDRLYLAPPASSEQILHPLRFLRGEAVRVVEALDVSLPGYQALPPAALGEWGLRLLLDGTLSTGTVIQIADGWGGDSYQLLADDAGNVAFVLAYLADGEPHAIEVGEGLVALATQLTGLEEGAEVEAGLLFETDGVSLFIDRRGEGLVFVAASDAAAGEGLRAQVSPPP